MAFMIYAGGGQELYLSCADSTDGAYAEYLKEYPRDPYSRDEVDIVEVPDDYDDQNYATNFPQV